MSMTNTYVRTLCEHGPEPLLPHRRRPRQLLRREAEEEHPEGVHVRLERRVGALEQLRAVGRCDRRNNKIRRKVRYNEAQNSSARALGGRCFARAIKPIERGEGRHGRKTQSRQATRLRGGAEGDAVLQEVAVDARVQTDLRGGQKNGRTGGESEEGGWDYYEWMTEERTRLTACLLSLPRSSSPCLFFLLGSLAASSRPRAFGFSALSTSTFASRSTATMGIRASWR